MADINQNSPEIIKIKDFVKDDRLDDAVKIIALYLGDSNQDNYLNRLENIIEMLLTLHGGRMVLRFLIEQLIIDIPSLLENLSKRDSVLRYSFLLLLKTLCENECDLFLPHSEDLLDSHDPNVREAALQLIIFMAGGEIDIEDESLVNKIVFTLADEKDFVVEKAIQALITIGRRHPSLITKAVTNFVKEQPENEKLKTAVDTVLKSVVTIEKIDELVEESHKEAILDEGSLEKEKIERIDKELELKKKEIEIKIKKLELKEKEKDLEDKIIQDREKTLKLKEGILEQETTVGSELEILPKKVIKQLKKEETEIIDKELELKKKEIEIKKKKLELEEKEKDLEEKIIQEREKTLKLKEEILEQETTVGSELEILPKKVQKQLKKEESHIIDREIELKKKEIEIKKKKLELEFKEREIEELAIQEKEKALKIKEELIEKETELSNVEIELHQKKIEEKEQRIMESELERAEEKIKKLIDEEPHNSDEDS